MEQIIVQEAAPWWTVYLPITAMYVSSAVAGFSVVQSVKTYRRGTNKTRPSHLALRGSGFIFTAVTCFAIGHYLIDLSLSDSLTHALVAGILQPVFVTIALSLTESRWPKIYNRIKVPDKNVSMLKDRDHNETTRWF